MSACGKRAWDVPDFDLEPPEEAVPMAWCDRCSHWDTDHAESGWGWCLEFGYWTEPEYTDECGSFDGEPPEIDDDPAWDAEREEGNDYDR